jgi:hypothetical protein
MSKVNKNKLNKCQKRIVVYCKPQGRFKTIATYANAGKPQYLWVLSGTQAT